MPESLDFSWIYKAWFMVIICWSCFDRLGRSAVLKTEPLQVKIYEFSSQYIFINLA